MLPACARLLVAFVLLPAAVRVHRNVAPRIPPPPAPVAAADSLPPPEAWVRYADAELLEARGQIAEATVEYEQVLALDPRSVGAARHLSDLAARAGDGQRSLEYADRAVAIDSTDARSHWLRGSALANLGRNDEALVALERAVRWDSTDADMQRTLARVAGEMDQVEVAAHAWRRATDLDEDDGEAWFQLAASEVRLGHFGAADSALDEAADLVPERAGTLFLRGLVREQTGRTAEAIDLYRKHLAVHTDDQLTRQRLVNLLVRNQRWAEALIEARTVTKALPREPDAWTAVADLAFRTGHAPEARQALAHLTQLAPDDPAMATRVASVLAHAGHEDEAVESARTWQAKHAGDVRGPTLVGGVLAAVGRTDSALVELRRAIAAAPDSLGPRIILARILQDRKRWPEAATEWREAFRRFPAQYRLGLDLGFCLEQAGDLDGAVAAARDVLKLAPEDPAALNFLGYLFADHNRNLGEAEKLIARALAREPGNGAYIDSRGWVEFRQGRLTEARRDLENAVRITGGDPEVREHLGDVYRKLDLADLAREQYRLALAADSTNTRLQGKLSSGSAK